MGKNSETLIILTPAFPADESETVWVRPKQLFVRKLRESFPSIQILILSFNYPLHNNKYEWKGIPVTSFNGLYTRKIRRVLMWMRVRRELKKIKKTRTVLGILSFWCGECALVGNHFANRNGLRHLIWISGMDAKQENRFVKWIRPKENQLIAMSLFLQKQFHANHHLRPEYVIPIGIDRSEYEERENEKDIDILGVGTLNPFKQYDIFIDIVKALSTQFSNIKAVICGEGTERIKLEEQIKKLGLESVVTLTGLTRHDDVLKLMQRAKIFLHPSSYEGFGAVCLEALYAGCRVISFCDPMELHVKNWYIEKTKDGMQQKAFEILNTRDVDCEPVLLYSMEDTAKAVMKLFDR